MSTLLHKPFAILQQYLWFPLDEWGFLACQRALLFACALLLALSACYGIKRLEDAKESLQRQTDALQMLNRENTRLAKITLGQEAKIKDFTQALDAAGKAKVWLEAMQARLRKHHLLLEELQMKPMRRVQTYAKRPFCLRARGRYPNVKAWLWHWSAKPYPGTLIERMQLQAGAPNIRMEVCGAYFQRR